MDHDALLRKIKRIRNARVDAKAAAENKPTRKARPKADPMKKLLAGMSDEDKAKLIAQLESKNDES